jgi:predicted Rossmann fold nucleotide-binding protein DprA/Smf involved in DNA uptake
VVSVPPWLGDDEGFEGSHQLMRTPDAHLLTSTRRFLGTLGLANCAAPPPVPLNRPLSADESALMAALTRSGREPLHLDEIAAHAACSAQTARAVLLTLALENVVVEGPPGFFRRRDGF